MTEQTLTEGAPSAPEDGTLNEQGQSSTPVDLPGDMISTAEYKSAPVEEPLTPDQKQAAEDKAKEEAEAKAKSEAEKVPFHEHPRFKEVIESRKQLQAKVDELEKRLSSQATPPTQQQKRQVNILQQIASMKDDELRDMLDENPKQVLSTTVQAAVEEALSRVDQHLKMTEEEKRTQTYQEGIKKTFDTFGEQHEDFWPMWESGELKKFMESNPGHNAISAYNVLKADSANQTMQEKIDAAVKEAVAKKEQEMLNNIKAKRSAQTLSPGASRGPGDGPPRELQDTKAKGGLTATLAERLKAMRQSA